MTSTRSSSVAAWFRLVRFSHTLFALPFAMVGYCVGIASPGYGFSWGTLLLVLLCMVTARSAAMAYNRIVDRHIDAQNPRTAQREIPQGRITVTQATWLVVLCALLFVGACALLNRLVLFLSPVALFVLLFYSHTKHWGAWCHLWLGLALGLSPLGAYLAVTGQFHITPIWLGVGVMLWTGAFDAIYSLQDYEFDAEHNLHSIPVRFGKKKTLWLSACMMLLALGALGKAVYSMQRGVWPLYPVGLFAAIIVWQFVRATQAETTWLNSGYMLINGINSLILGTALCVGILLNL